jgi:glyoxylase-like metal-dependent hydrolase (beta-lactamase superfamily II)
MPMLPTYGLYALKYGHHHRMRSANFLGGDPHDGPMPMDYFVWLARGDARTFVIDTGFSEAGAARRKRQRLRSPAEALALLDVDAAQVTDVIITHLHYDHVGNFDLFPAATFHLQDREMHYATGRYMCFDCFGHSFEVEEVVGMVRKVYAGRVEFHDGDADIAPGISVHLIGGHTMGLQVVRVYTKRGWVVVASDAAHYYENMEARRPYSTVFNVGEMTQGWARLRELADSPAHIVPGHDPEVLARYPAARKGLEGIVARLDVAPAK